VSKSGHWPSPPWSIWPVDLLDTTGHSAFSRVRHEWLHKVDFVRQVFERVVEACTAVASWHLTLSCRAMLS
jgi:hypothetical protein